MPRGKYQSIFKVAISRGPLPLLSARRRRKLIGPSSI